METIRIAHLYYDLMNLYGENGNVRVLIKHLEDQNIKVITDYLSLEDEIDFTKYDIFYMGCGNLDNFKIVLENIKKYQKDIQKAIKNNKFFLVTGSALNLFGKVFTDLEGVSYDTLNLLDFKSQEVINRIVGEQEFSFHLVKEPVIGFQNRDTILTDVNELHLFEVVNGVGYLEDSHFEGILKNNFYGTYLLGPILVRNPYFTEYLVKEILQSKNLEYQNKKYNYEIKAYEEYFNNIIKKEC